MSRLAANVLDFTKSMAPGRRTAALYRHEGSTWSEIERFGSIGEAQVALDEEIGQGYGDASDYRGVPIPQSRAVRVGKIALWIVGGLVWLWYAYRIFG